MNAAERVEEFRHMLRETREKIAEYADESFYRVRFEKRLEALLAGAEAIERVARLEEALKELTDTCDELMERHGISADTSKARAALAPADARGEKGGAENG